MRHLGMIDGAPEPAADPVWIDKYEVVNSKMERPLRAPRRDGLLRQGRARSSARSPTISATWKEDVRAPFTGILLYVIGTPPCNEGEPLFEVGRVKEK